MRVAAPVAGQLQELHVRRGDRVERGAALFVLESGREQAAMAEAQAQLETAQAQLADLRKGKRAEEIAVIRAQLVQAQAQLQLAEAQEKRQQDLRRRGLASAEQLDQAQTELERAQARVVELGAQLRTAELAARSDAIRAAEGKVRAAQAQLEQAAWPYAHKAVAAPEAAEVEDVYYRAGEWVAGGAPVVSLLPPQNRIVRFYVPEPALARMRVGAAVLVHCDGCAAPVPARIRFVAGQAEYTPPVIYSRERRETLVFRAEAGLDAADAAKLHPGQPVDVVPAP